MTKALLLLIAGGSVALLAQGPPKPAFEPMQPELFAAGANLVNAFADIDGDGDLDLFVGFDGAPNRLYRNDNGVFSNVASAAGMADARATRAAAWGDFDADGDPDLILGFTPGAAGPVLRLYRNDAAKFTDITTAAGLAVATGAVRQPSFVDFDADGDLDLFIGFRDRANALFRNDAGKFTDIAAGVGLADARKTVGAVWFDYDQDGDLDVAVANMDGDANGLFRNDQGMFTDVAAAAGVQWGGRAPNDKGYGTVRVCAGDLDGDGRLDLIAANYGPLGFFSNRGAGTFEDRAAAWGLAIDSRYDSCAPADFDNDGKLDLYVNGTVTGGASFQDTLFRNHGAGFDDVTPANLRALQADHGVQWADVDGDGDLDLALNGSRPDGMHLVMRNLLPAADAARSVQVRVLDAKGHSTLAGAEVRVFAAGSQQPIGTRLVDSGSGYDAQSDMPVHVGIPAGVKRVDVQVIVPAKGARTGTWQRGVAPGAKVLVMRAKVGGRAGSLGVGGRGL
ncbi:MAG: CRTAC1 family protein [Vicinamibacterales bacterium]